MPEGDTVHGAANRLRERIGGMALLRLGGSAPCVRRHSQRLRGACVEKVEAVGKHLLVEFEGGWTLRVHLGMTGRWRFGPPTGPRGDRSARVVLETAEWAARCYDAPTVDLDRSPRVRAFVADLGPDLSLPSPDLDEALARARRREGETTVTEVLLDQSVASGMGNVYRNEVMFEMGIHPSTVIGEVDDNLLERLLDRAARHLRLNSGRRRTTTGARRAGMNHYVYERAGRPCRRCGARIRKARTVGRASFWCPSCQPHLSGAGSGG